MYNYLMGRGFARWSEGKYTKGQRLAASDYINSFILLSGAYRSGKSELGARLSIRHAIAYPGAKVGVFRAHLASLKKSTLATVLELIHPSWISNWSNSDLVLTFKNSSVISFLGCEFSDRIGSIELTYAFLDEAHEILPESLGMILGRLSGRLSLPPYLDSLDKATREYAISCVDKRQVLLACNPKHKGHHLYQRFFENPKPGHIHYSSNTLQNPNLHSSYLSNILSAYVLPSTPSDWVLSTVKEIEEGKANWSAISERLTPFGQRNLLGKWVALEGAVYPMLDEIVHCVDEVPTDWGEPTGYYGAVDWGFHNPRAIVAAVYTDTKILVLDYFHKKDIKPSEFIKELSRLTSLYPIKRWYMPPDQPGLISEAKAILKQHMCWTAKNDVARGIDCVSRYLSTQKLLFSKPPTLFWSEMSGYEWDKNREGLALDKPKKTDDHYCLVAGTQVASERGEIPIEQLKPGDLVWTRQGLKPVVSNSVSIQEKPTVTLVFEDGTTLTGTEDHPVWVLNRGFTSIREIKLLTKVKALKLTNTLRLDVASTNVVGSWDSQKENVYTLTVADAHEYFANGVLVSNCDAVRYLCLSLAIKPVYRPDADQIDLTQMYL